MSDLSPATKDLQVFHHSVKNNKSVKNNCHPDPRKLQWTTIRLQVGPQGQICLADIDFQLVRLQMDKKSSLKSFQKSYHARFLTPLEPDSID